MAHCLAMSKKVSKAIDVQALVLGKDVTLRLTHLPVSYLGRRA